MNITFITGNAHKAAYIADALGEAIQHQKMTLDEIQSLDLKQIVAHKAYQAYAIVKKPVLVEDVSLEFLAFGRLPGPFIKWFVDEIGNQKLCHMLQATNDRRAIARVCYGLFDGSKLYFFTGSIQGSIAKEPRGNSGFGWDQLFIKKGMQQTRAELDDATEKATSMRRQPLQQLRQFLRQNS